MPLKKFKFLSIFLVAFGLLSYQYLPSQKKSVQKSFSPHFNVSQFSSRGVVDRVIKLKFQTTEKSDETDVVALVSLPFDFEGKIQYKWTLGQNVNLAEGSLTGFSDLQFTKDEPKKIRITVKGFDPKQLRHIGFEAWTDKNGRRLFVDGLISSQQANSFEDIVQNVEKIKAEKSGIQK